MARYTSAEVAVGVYLLLVARLRTAGALDHERAAARAPTPSHAPDAPDGLDELIALERCLKRLHCEVSGAKWRLWELQRLNLIAARPASSLYNSELIAAGGERGACITHTTAAAWRIELDARFEVLLSQAGLWRAGVGEGR